MSVFHPRGRLDSFVEGGLTGSARARVAEHIGHCSDCRQEVHQRERILQAARSLHDGPRVTPVARPPSTEQSLKPYASGTGSTVLEARTGVAGWKVVVGMGALGLAAVGLVSSAWIAGAPRPGVDPLGHVPQPAGSERGVGEAGASAAPLAPDGAAPLTSVPTVPASPSAAASNAGGPPDPAFAEAEETPEDPSDLSHRISNVALSDLRQRGWNAPSLAALGLTPSTVAVQQYGPVAEVTVTLDRPGARLVLHECRAVADTGDLTAADCPSARDESVADRQPVATGDHQLAGGTAVQTEEFADGTWSAWASTGVVSYRVESDLPREAADGVMDLVMISDRSRLSSAPEQDTPTDRLTRGFDRLLPWTSAE